MPLIRLKVSLGWGGGGGRRHEDLFFWVLLGAGGKGWREGRSMTGERKKGSFIDSVLCSSLQMSPASSWGPQPPWRGSRRHLQRRQDLDGSG